MGVRRLYAALLAAALIAAVSCSPDAAPAPATPSAPHSDSGSGSGSDSASDEPSASARTAWQASQVRVRPDWVGADAPWVWEYSDDVVVIAPRGLVALDRETGAEVWRLPLGGRVCGATPSPSEVGLVAVTVGPCRAATRPSPGGARIATGAPATARRTTVKAVDLESASVVWERAVDGAPQLEIGGEVLLAVDGCGTRRIDVSSGRPLGGLGIACSDRVLAADGVVMISAQDAPNEWRVVDVASGSSIAEVGGTMTMSAPRRILTADPLTVLAAANRDHHLQLVRVDSDELRVLADLSSVAMGAFFAWSGHSLVLADEAWPGAAELSLEDGSTLGGFPGVGGRWIPFDLYGDGVLGFEGTPEGLSSGHGRLTLRSLGPDRSVVEVGELGGTNFRGETNLAVAAPKAVVIDDILLLPGRGNSRVLAYRLSVPD